MGEILKAVKSTCYPDGKIQVYENGALIRKRPSKGINYWFIWLKIVNR